MRSETLSDIVFDSMTFLELPAVLEELEAHALSEPGRRKVLSIQPEDDLHLVKASLDLVCDLQEMVRLHGPLGLGQLVPMEGLFRRLESPSSILDSEEILAVGDLLAITDTTRSKVEDLGDRFRRLKDFTGNIVTLGSLRNRISRTIDEQGVVRPDAEPSLFRIHERMRAARGYIRKSLEGFVNDRDLARIVQEDYVTLRNDRYVILLRPEFKGLLDGIIHDHSRSGASVYVEPFQVVALNNQVASLVDEERAEIRKIFQALTEEIRAAVDELHSNFETLVLLDTFQARALYAETTSSKYPELVDDGFRILGARHPLLLAAGELEVVPMDVIQESGTTATIISGANMGGKTVALKIAGLFPLMIRCGMLVPAEEGTRIHPFMRIMADIGDDQDIRERVSSFSGHMLRIKTILETASAGDLVLLDELGGATDPEEGAALAMAIIDELIERHTRVVVTTHLSHLKAYALGRSDAKNVSVEFHPRTLRPTFRLLYDLPGESHAIMTAEFIGLDQRVLNTAKRYYDASAGGSTKLIRNLKEEIDRVEGLRRDLEQKKKILDKELDQITSQKAEIVEEFRIECLQMIRKAEKQIAGIQKSLRDGALESRVRPRDALLRIKEEMVAKLETPLEKVPKGPEVGSIVTLTTLGKEGTVTAVFDNGRRVDVAVGKLTVKAHVSDLVRVRGGEEKKKSTKKVRIGVDIPIATPMWEVKVIGLRVEEALPVVEKAIDEALLGGLPSINIIHGRGTGRLKQAVRDYLSRHPLVRDFHGSDPSRGGEAVTEVELATD